jgi:tetratricopeptide (TPR) repeat protein
MRAELADASLARYAGQFVWLALDFDKPENQSFVVGRGVLYTPTFYVLDPRDEHALATQLGAMTLAELRAFLDRGEDEMLAKTRTPADAALAKGDDLFAHNQAADAAKAYEETLRLIPQSSPQRERAAGDLVFALSTSRQWQPCAETAAAEAPHMARQSMFGRVVLEGLNCTDYGDPAPWAATARGKLEPLAVEAIPLPSTVRDYRFKLYQELMGLAKDRGDAAALNKWGNSWLAELDTTQAASDDERSALDIARVDAATLMENPKRVLPALIASEDAMPKNYNASLRVGQMELAAENYDKAIAACDRGLPNATGPIGRAWLMEVKADALRHLGRTARAHQVLEDALPVAREIGPEQIREHNIKKISEALKETEKPAK